MLHSNLPAWAAEGYLSVGREVPLGLKSRLQSGLASEAAQEFMATMVAMGLPQVIPGPNQDSGHTLDMIVEAVATCSGGGSVIPLWNGQTMPW